jgi:hypothetical protein
MSIRNARMPALAGCCGCGVMSLLVMSVKVEAI